MSDRTDVIPDGLRGQVGIGTLIIFIAMVLVAAIAAGVLIETAGFLQSKSEQPGRQNGEQVTNRLQVLEVTGLVTAQDTNPQREIGGVKLLSTKGPGAEDISLTGLTIQWVDDTGTYSIVHEDVYEASNPDADGKFANAIVKDSDSSLSGNSPVLNSPDDRVTLVIDIGEAELSETFGGTAEIFNAYDTGNSDTSAINEEGLDGGTTASLPITTSSGTATNVQLVVPESLSGKSAVRL